MVSVHMRVPARAREAAARVAGRAVTGPVAFLMAGVIDVVVAWAQWSFGAGRRRWRQRCDRNH